MLAVVRDGKERRTPEKATEEGYVPVKVMAIAMGVCVSQANMVLGKSFEDGVSERVTVGHGFWYRKARG